MERKVLVIDDEKDICRLLSAFLSAKGYLVHAAYTLADGMDLMVKIHPDIIFLDNNLPDGLGWDKIEWIHELLPSCKINLISAYKFIPDFVKHDSSISLIEKPISFSTLLNYL